MSTATIVAGSVALLLALALLYSWLTTPPRLESRRRGRDRRRGGYIKPPASSTQNPVTTYTIAGTRTTEDYCSSLGALGDRRAGSEILRTRLEASRNGEDGSSTSATARAGANGAQRGSVDWSKARAAESFAEMRPPA